MTKVLKRVLIMAGGTGGHVFPGLAIAEYLRAQNIEVYWLGTQRGMESQLVPQAGLPFHHISIDGIRGKGWRTWMTAPFKVLTAIREAKRHLHQLQPDVVIGMGGFVSGPGGFASWLYGYPLIIHEQNAKAGLTNRLLSYVAKKILAGFPSAFTHSSRVMVVGNPVRPSIEALPEPMRGTPIDRPLHLLIVGGSLGAQILNERVPEAIALLSSGERPLIKHQTGEKSLKLAQAAYATNGVQAEVIPFIQDMASAYAWADVVLCRAGALTVAELCAAGVGAIMIPYPYAVDDHQTLNAQFMVEGGAGICIPQASLTASGLAAQIRQFVASRDQCIKMAIAAYRLRRVQVAEKIVEQIRLCV